MDVFAAMTGTGQTVGNEADCSLPPGDPKCQIKGAERINVGIDRFSEEAT